MVNENINGWSEWSKYVLAELKRLDNSCACLEKDLQAANLEIAILKVKAGIWGVLGGAIPVIIGLAIYFIHKLVS